MIVNPKLLSESVYFITDSKGVQHFFKVDMFGDLYEQTPFGSWVKIITEVPKKPK